MGDRLDEHELLDLIEGELDAGAANALRARLAGDAQTHARVEAMMADRAALRALGHPELPRDFVARLEPLLARPMLIETHESMHVSTPGEFRRRTAATRVTHRVRWGRLAAAAALLVATFAGVWAALNGLLAPSRGGSAVGGAMDGSAIARNETGLGAGLGAGIEGLGADVGSTIATAPAAAVAERGTRHHYRPLPLSLPSDAVALAAGAAHENHASEAGAAEFTAAEFAIVVHSRDVAAVEQALERAMTSMTGMTGVTKPGALVRNFSFAEAQQLAANARLGNPEPNGAPAPLAVADLTGVQRDLAASAALAQLAAQVRDQLGSRSVAGDAGASSDASGRIAGDAAALPALESQLDFSSRGATHTVSMPAADVARFIERLALEHGLATALEMLPPSDPLELLRADAVPTAKPSAATGDQSPSSALRWLTEGPRVRQALAQLAPVRRDAIILVPVIVRPE